MTFASRNTDPPEVGTTIPAQTAPSKPDTLPALLRQRDLALLVVLVTIIASDVQGMQFAETAIWCYWLLALVTFQLPSLWIFSWLTRQAPRRVPLYVWILRLVPECWRSVLLFLIWWAGVLIALAILGMCLPWLSAFFPPWFSAFPVQCLAFAILLLLATLLTALPLRFFRLVLWTGGLCYLGAFVFATVVTLLALLSGRTSPGVVLLPPRTALPTPFSWSLFGLALLCLFGLNGPLLLDGEMQGAQRFLRGSTGSLWWGGLGAFLFLLCLTFAWIFLDPTLHVIQTPLLQVILPLLGPQVGSLYRLLLLLGTFGCVLAYLFVFARAFLLAARMGYLPRSLTVLSRWGTPSRAILTQSVLILCTAVLFFVVAPALLRDVLPAGVVNTLGTGDQFSLFTSIAGSLWCVLTALMFVFACWLCWKKRQHGQGNRRHCLVLSVCCLSGTLTSLTCALAPLLPGWPALFFSRIHWYPLVLLGISSSLALAWMVCELPRRSALVRARERSVAREKALREQVQQGYARERKLREQLQVSYAEVQRLYRAQEQVARTDPVTGLLNHGAFLEQLEEAIVRAQTEASGFVLCFLDLDHFKAINDTWGHLAGDAVLHEVGKRLREALQPGSVVGRYGGEEFTLLLVGATLTHAYEAGERLRRFVQATPCLWQPTAETRIEIGITASIGVVAYGPHGTQSTELLQQADQAMYEAKLAGRNGVRVAHRTRTSRQ